MATAVFDTHTFVKSLPVTRERLDNRLLQMEQRLTIRPGGMIVVAVGVIAALVKVL